MIKNNYNITFLPYGNRFRTVLNARRSEQWESIIQELVSWHGILAFRLQGIGIETYFNTT